MVLSHLDYSLFGNRLESFGEAFPRFGYSSRYCDYETQQLYYGYRFFNTRYERWLSRDFIWENDSPNLFIFNHNAPNRFVDPLGLKVWLETSPIAFGTDHCSLVIETCDEKGLTWITYQISPRPTIPPLSGEQRGVSDLTKELAVGAAIGVGGWVWIQQPLCGIFLPGFGLGAYYILDNLSPGPRKSIDDPNEERRSHLYVVDETYDNDQKYIQAAENEQFGIFDLLFNNCCHWTRRVISSAGGAWPLGHRLNYGFNKPNPEVSPEDETDEIDKYPPKPKTPTEPGAPN